MSFSFHGNKWSLSYSHFNKPECDEFEATSYDKSFFGLVEIVSKWGQVVPMVSLRLTDEKLWIIGVKLIFELNLTSFVDVPNLGEKITHYSFKFFSIWKLKREIYDQLCLLNHEMRNPLFGLHLTLFTETLNWIKKCSLKETYNFGLDVLELEMRVMIIFSNLGPKRTIIKTYKINLNI